MRSASLVGLADLRSCKIDERCDYLGEQDEQRAGTANGITDRARDPRPAVLPRIRKIVDERPAELIPPLVFAELFYARWAQSGIDSRADREHDRAEKEDERKAPSFCGLLFRTRSDAVPVLLAGVVQQQSRSNARGRRQR